MSDLDLYSEANFTQRRFISCAGAVYIQRRLKFVYAGGLFSEGTHLEANIRRLLISRGHGDGLY
jgi:hypothetical protein